MNKAIKLKVTAASERMMRRIAMFIFAIMISVFGVMNQTAKAVSPNPPPDCWEDFDGPLTATITIDNCVFNYTYWYRTACGGAYHDTYIEDISMDPNSPQSCLDIFDAQYEKIVDAVMADVVIMQNPWGTQILYLCDKGELSPTQWRFFRPSCLTDRPVKYWKTGPSGDKGNIVIGFMPCQSPEQVGFCCQTYRYCFKEVVDPITGKSELALESHSLGSTTFGRINCPGKIKHDGEEVNCKLTCDE